MRLSVVIPCFNERRTVETVVDRVRAVDLGPVELEIVLVDDGSTDGTAALLAALAERHDDVRAVFQGVNQGKGAALARGFREATGDAFLVQDGDLEYSPSDYPALLAPLLAGDADVVYGSRYLAKKWTRARAWHRAGNQALTLYSNALYYAALRRMAFICDALGRYEDAERYRDLAARSRQSIHDAFWNEAGYFNNAVQWGIPDTALMLADNAIALVERIASRNERFRTLETLRERSWRPYGTVTTALPMRYVPAD